MTVVSQTFKDRWRSGDHTGPATPAQVVRVRTGRFRRSYATWNGPKVQATIPGESKDKPWRAVWTPDSAWVEVPGVMEVNLDQSFDQNGTTVASLVIENILYKALVNLSVSYWSFKRGLLSPVRGFYRADWPNIYPADPDWFGVLAQGAQIEVQQGYGGDTMIPTFTGLVEKVDLTSQPDRITVSLRDFGGKPLGQRVFGDVKSKQLREPVVFMKRPKVRGVAVGSKAVATSSRTGHPPRFATDKDVTTRWLSATHTTDAFTEWLEIRLPKGRYEDILIHPAYRGMIHYIGVYAKDNNLGGELPQRNGEDIPEGWVDDGNDVPGGNGGWPYLKKTTLDARGQHVSLGSTFELGDDSIVRVAFRNLFKVGRDQYRAGLARLAAVKEASSEIIIRPEGYNGDASSVRHAPEGLSYNPDNVCDNNRQTRWLSVDHTTPSFTEWVEVHLPQGRYRSFNIENAYPGMTMYVGVFARERRSGVPSMMDNANVDEWIDGGLGDVPGGNGGWPYLLKVENAPGPQGSSTKYQFGHKLELGPNSVLRVAYRNLHQADPGKYRAGTIRLQGNRITYRDPAAMEAAKRVIFYEDASDIVKVALRWAGFEEWEVEQTGTTFNGRLMFTRSDTLADIVKKVADATGYCFFIAPPTVAGTSIGVPVFREAQVLKEDVVSDAVGDWTVLTGIQGMLSDEPKAYIIRVRGAYASKKDGGKTLGSDSTRRIMAVYRPPWTRNGRTDGVLIHHVHTDRQLQTQEDVDLSAILVGLREALAGSACRIELPGSPQFDLDDQLTVLDDGTGIFSRIYVTNRSSRFVQSGESSSWKTTLAGAMLDTPDVIEARGDLFAKLSELGKDRLEIGGSPVQL